MMLVQTGHYWSKTLVKFSIRSCLSSHSFRCSSNNLNYYTSAFHLGDFQKYLYFSTTSHETNANGTTGKQDHDDQEPGKLLYRWSDTRVNLPRYFIGYSTCQMVFWIWYVGDFTPALIAKNFHVSYTVGGVGVGVSALWLFLSCSYPRYLISEIRELEKGEVLVKTFALPFATRDKVGKTYSAGTLKIKQYDQDRIIKKGSLTNYGAHLGITNPNERYPLLLNPKPDEVMNEGSLVSLLLHGSLSSNDKKELRRQSDEEGGQDSGKEVRHQRRGYVRVTQRPKSTRQLPRKRP